MNQLVLPILLPVLAGVLCLALGERAKGVKEALSAFVSLVCFAVGWGLLEGTVSYSVPWAGFGFEFALRATPMSAFVLLAASGFALLVSVYSWAFMRGKGADLRLYYSYLLITLGFTCGAVLADNLVLLLFFWEGLLVTLYTFIVLGGRTAQATALKAFLISGVADLCLLLGVAITGVMAKTMTMSSIRLTVDGLGGVAFILMMIGATAKAGAMPFHTWIPDAAVDAPLPFMAFLPAALEKLLGIYLLARISLDLFGLDGSMRVVLMALGAVTIVLAVAMALVQTDYKRLLSYHAISQVGYMILGIGTGNPVGIAGGFFHMINHAMYKSCLFMTGGSVEHKAGTTDIAKLGGLFRNMPVTGLCFIVSAAAISGIPPFNGFFSKELVFQGCLDAGYPVFFWAAQLGAVLTLASFLKLGHSVYFGERPADKDGVREAEWSILLPMIALAALCVLFGFGAHLPLSRFIEPALASCQVVPAHALSGWHWGFAFAASLCAIAVAALNHLFGFWRTGKAMHAAEHIHHAPVLRETYELAARRVFDPYDQGLKLLRGTGLTLFAADRALDFVTADLPARAVVAASGMLRRTNNGLYPYYLAWALLGLVVFALFVGGNP
jgi:NADH-quinone oxidoreductase subunit L